MGRRFFGGSPIGLEPFLGRRGGSSIGGFLGVVGSLIGRFFIATLNAAEASEEVRNAGD